MNTATRTVLSAAGWVWILVFVLIGVLGAGLHVVDHFNAVADRPQVAGVLRDHLYGPEFFEHWLDFRSYPVARMTHMVFGIIFVLIAPLQLVPRVRASFPRLHRSIGRTVLAMSVVLIATGWIFAFAHSYTGFPEQVPLVSFTIIYAWLIYMGITNIRARNFDAHREWMVRAFAMMMGISATRVWFYLFLKTTDVPSTHFFSSIFWLGLGVNLLVAEIWIHLTRQRAVAAASQPKFGWLQSTTTRSVPGTGD